MLTRHTPSCLAAATLLLLAHSASQAVLLVPGVITPLPGTTSAAEPQLAGLVLEDKLFDYSMNTAKGLVTGQIQSRVVRSSVDGTLDFYWRVTNDPNSLDDVGYFRIGLFNAPEYNSNYRIDGVGDLAPVSAFRFSGGQESYVNYAFFSTSPNGASSGLRPGQSSNFIFMDTSATQYVETAIMDVADFDTSHISTLHPTFTPGVPEPQTYGLMALGLLMLGARRYRR